jgi:chemotaxis receptor (MCP) glutamine deamidase CheD
MFSFGSQNGSRLEIGARNERAVREALRAASIPVAVAVTGGSTGRTVRVHVAEGLVTCKEAGKGEYAIYGGETALQKAA